MMSSHHLTRHAELRLRQRGFRPSDMDVLLGIASQVTRDSYVLMEKDVASEIQKLKRMIQDLERLKGCRLVVESGAVVTCYRPSKATQKRMARESKAEFWQ